MHNEQDDKNIDSREITNVNLFADDISFSDTEKILFEEDLNEEVNETDPQLMDGNPAERYTIVRKLNEGGMKAIWEVDDHRTARKVAMAIIQESKIASEKDINAFLYEARLTANLQHPNIIPIYDIALDENGNPYFTMKALKGSTLDEILKAKKNNTADPKYTRTHLISVFLRVCNAIAYAHSKGVLHLDLKPSNVIIGDYGDVHVLDWGLSTLLTHLPDENPETTPHWHTPDNVALESGETLTHYLESDASQNNKRNVIGGTPGYMSPEQAQASPADIDFRTDTYMLGALLYEILTLHHAIEGKTTKEVLKKTIEGEVAAPNTHNKKIPSALSAITMKALSPVKEERYSSVGALIQDIHQFQDGYATQAENPTFFTHLTLLIKRHKKAVGLIALFSVLLIFILTQSIISIKASEKQAILAQHVATKRLIELEEKNEYINNTAKKVAPDYLALFKEEEADYKFKRAEATLNTGLAFDPSMEEGRFNKAILLICQQQFERAKNFLPPQHPLYHLADTWSAPISSEQITTFVKQLKAYAPDALARFFYHLNQQPISVETAHFTAIENSLQLLNPACDPLNFKYAKADQNSWRIDLSNNPRLQTIAPLCGLPIQAINASGSSVPNLNIIASSSVKQLNVSNTTLNHLYTTDVLKTIEILNISQTNIRNLNEVLKLNQLTTLSISGISELTIPQQLIFNQKLKFITLSREHQHNQTIQALANRGVIMIYTD